MRFRFVVALLIIAILTSCNKASVNPDPITDGISCIVTAKMNGTTQILQLTRSGEAFDSVFLHSDGSRGLGLTVSPSGCFIDVYKVKKQIDMEYISHSLPVLIYKALNHNFIDDVYSDGAYRCTDSCGEFEMYVGQDGVISKIIFLKYDYICDFDYKTA